MNKSVKLRCRAVLSLILSIVLFCMPVMAFSINKDNAIDVKAEGKGKSSAKKGTESSTEESATGQETENGTVTGNDTEPVCTCVDKCGAYEYDYNCKVCVEDYKLCAYKKPNVAISINKPDGWFKDTVTVTFTVTDVAHTGNFEVAGIQAKIGQDGGWTDVTEDKELSISENCTVYVQVTDQNGNTYERNRAVKCFDTTKPTLNAAVSDGLLSVQVYDTDSGVKAAYVNGYKYTKFTNGTLNIRLQQFDAGYEYFTISAMDNAGNMSETYQTKNPYYKDPADESEENPADQLPVNAEATKPGNSTGTVTEHTQTDSDGNTVSKKKNSKKQSKQGKEFYTIQTKSEKVFYLIVDRDGEEETVRFLTDVTENDLLNTTSGNSETLPKNSAALESAIPSEEGALPNNNGETPEDTQQEGENKEEEKADDKKKKKEEKEKTEEPDPTVSYILMGALAVAFIGGAYYFKVVRKKKEDFIEDEDEDREDEEEYENEDEELGDSSEDDFFDEDTEE